MVTILDNSTSLGKMWAYVARAEDQLHLGWVFRDYLDCGTWTSNQPLDGYAFQYKGEPSNTVANFEQCVLSCRRAENCSAYVFFKSRRLCRLMTRSDAILERSSDAVSGYKVHPRTAAIPSIQSPPIPGENQNSSARLDIPLEEEGGVLVVPVLINRALTLGFVIDSGASDVSVPADVVMTLVRTGTLQDADFITDKARVWSFVGPCARMHDGPNHGRGHYLPDCRSPRPTHPRIRPFVFSAKLALGLGLRNRRRMGRVIGLQYCPS
jgi:hypothetical protein